MRKVRVAVVGSGLAGLSAAHMLSQTDGVEAEMFERNPGLGMDAGSIEVPCECSTCKSTEQKHFDGRIDVPMRSFFPEYYPYLTSLYDAVNIPYRQSDNSMAFFSTGSLDPMDPTTMFHTPYSYPTKLQSVSDCGPGKQGSAIPAFPPYFSFSCYNLPYPIRNLFAIPDLPPVSLLFSNPIAYAQAVRRSIIISTDYLRFLQYCVQALDSGIISQAKLGKGPLANMTFGQCIQSSGVSYSDEFWSVFLPLFSGACTCTFDDLKQFPAHIILEYSGICLPDGKLSFVTCGTNQVCARLAEPVQRVHVNTTVLEIIYDKTAQKFTLTTVETRQAHLPASDQTRTNHVFDYVIFATQANQASRILKETRPCSPLDENNNHYVSFVDKATRVLEKFPYTKSLVVCHTDTRLMPSSRNLWRCLNFGVLDKHLNNQLKADNASGMKTAAHSSEYNVHGLAMCTHYSQMTHTEVPECIPPIFQTTNPIIVPDPASVISATWYERAIVRLDTLDALKELEGVQGGCGGGVWFVGSFVGDGIPLLESCVTSAVKAAQGVVADAFGGNRELYLPKEMVQRVRDHEMMLTRKKSVGPFFQFYVVFAVAGLLISVGFGFLLILTK